LTSQFRRSNALINGEILEINRAQRKLGRSRLSQLFTEKSLRAKGERDPAICRAYLEFGYSMAAIAPQAGIQYSTVSKIISGER
jgi:hypothetical protein